MKVNFHELNSIADIDLKFAVIGTRYKDKWVFVRHKERDTWEIPGGHREPNENINDTAQRELYEETGAIEYNLTPICEYSVSRKGEESFGRLFYCEVSDFKLQLNYEIQERRLFSKIPKNLTYPKIMPFLLENLKALYSM